MALKIKLNCDFVLQVLWYRDTMQLDTTERRIMESRGSRHTLVIRKVHSSDFGNYTCVADNQLGKSRKSITLTGKNGKKSNNGYFSVNSNKLYKCCNSEYIIILQHLYHNHRIKFIRLQIDK